MGSRSKAMSKVDQKNLFIQGLKIPWWKPDKER